MEEDIYFMSKQNEVKWVEDTIEGYAKRYAKKYYTVEVHTYKYHG